ncbi:S8 family peptidase [Subtercola sp. PAMC28395]|uniref:S8 family peptidase n=1 Tax=Subtercola sp. PAMC28395 TaxID=2846775 RepID=UPI00209B4D25|nr:S8 family peptidase [Subtercola sp. PAMC28395]
MSIPRRRFTLPHDDVFGRTARRRRGLTVAAALAAVVLGATGAATSAAAFPAISGVSAAASQGTTPSIGFTPLPSAPTQPVSDFTDGRYVVAMTNPAASTYTGGLNGFGPTKPDKGSQMNARSAPVTSYTDFLASQQKDVASSVGASVDYSYTLAFNGFSANLTAAQASALTANKNVARVTRDELKHITAAEPSTTFLGLDGPSGVWAKNGGVDAAGDGIVVGDIDTGIAPENPSFAGDALGTTPGAAPYLDSSAPAGVGPITFAKADGNTFHGECVTGEQFTTADCTTKIVGARYYLDGFGAGNIGTAATGEYVSPRDGDGHGSHTGSTAVGNNAVTATVGGDSFGQISGVAPAAKISVYKVCWSGPDPASSDDDGCTNADMLAAIDQAVADGVDVLNFSIGGSSALTTVSDTDVAFLGAASAGIFVAASAGNSGPSASTLDNASPWYTTVAASTIPSYEATATLGTTEKFAGGSITVQPNGSGPLTGPLVRADLVKLASATAADALLCAPGSLDPAKVAGKIVFCQRGVYDRTAKSAEVLRAGGTGMLLVNKTPSSIDLDEHSVPTVHLDSTAWDTTYAYSALPAATVTLSKGNTAGPSPAVPQLAGFSSHGPVLGGGSDILKPDITAPGVAILAAAANAQGGDPTWEFLSGTSMAAPHIAGLAALYLGVHPLATPAEIKSAMMTTAGNTVDSTGADVTDVFGQGAGNVDPTKYFNPGLLYLNTSDQWWQYIAGMGYDVTSDPPIVPIDPSDLNLASIAIGSLTGSQTVTRTVTSTQAGTFTASPVSIPGITTVVSPTSLSFDAAGESKSYTVSFTRTDAPLNEFATGYLSWTSGDTVVRSPLAVQPVALLAPAVVTGTGTTGSVDVPVTPGADGAIPLVAEGLAKGDLLLSTNQDPSLPLGGHSAVQGQGTPALFDVTVPAGVSYARFDLHSVTTAEQGADLDLTVDLIDDANGGAVLDEWVSATGAANERVNIASPAAGHYRLSVDVFSLPTGQSTAAMDMRSFLVSPAGGSGSFTVPPAIDGTQGTPTSYTASWRGLDYSSPYLGSVAYGDTGLTTMFEVTTEAAPPTTPTPTPTDTASPVPTVPGTPTPTSSNSASAVPDPGSGGGSGLASTGLTVLLPIGLAGILLLAGISALVVRRRRAASADGGLDE